MDTSLKGKRVAILATDGFEQSELLEPKKALEKAGASPVVVSLKSGSIKGWKDGNWGESVVVNKTIDEVSAADFDGLVLPGGVMNPDKLRAEKKVIEFIKNIFDAGKPVAAICHGPWTLVEANVVKGRKLTSYKSIKTDIVNAGGNWVDEEVVTDRGLVTSRTPADLPAFNKKMVEEFAEGNHNRKG